MADDEQASDSPDDPETKDSGQESSRPEDSHNPELNLSASSRTSPGDLANLPRKPSEEKGREGEKDKGASTDTGDSSREDDPPHREDADHGHDDYH
ncbi:uncharacterized protein METZ01_LOCUS330543, partial [marine metagenome]